MRRYFDELVRVVGIVQIARVEAGVCGVIVRRLGIGRRELSALVVDAERKAQLSGGRTSRTAPG